MIRAAIHWTFCTHDQYHSFLLSFLSSGLVFELDPAPDAGGARAINATSARFYLRGKGTSGEGNTLLGKGGPLLIDLPQLTDSAPGEGIQFTASIQKLLQGIVLSKSRSGGLVKERQGPVFVVLMARMNLFI
jgi:hypothetical protein